MPPYTRSGRCAAVHASRYFTWKILLKVLSQLWGQGQTLLADARSMNHLAYPKKIEDVLSQLGYDVEICRRGINNWEISHGSARSTLLITNLRFLIADASLCYLPMQNMGAIYTYLLKQNFHNKGMTFALKDNNIVISSLIYDPAHAFWDVQKKLSISWSGGWQIWQYTDSKFGARYHHRIKGGGNLFVIILNHCKSGVIILFFRAGELFWSWMAFQSQCIFSKILLAFTIAVTLWVQASTDLLVYDTLVAVVEEKRRRGKKPLTMISERVEICAASFFLWFVAQRMMMR